MVEQPIWSGGEPSSHNCKSSAGVKARHLFCVQHPANATPFAINMNRPEQSQLGQTSIYPTGYDASLLFPISRMPKRLEIGIKNHAECIFFGADLWTAFEVSWLNSKRKPQIAIANIVVPCNSPNIIESKSLKLYLNGINNVCFADAQTVQTTIKADLTHAAGAFVAVELVHPADFDAQMVQELDGLDLDRLDIECNQLQLENFANAEVADVVNQRMIFPVLEANHSSPPVSEVLTSRLLKSNCLVTGQPDWASIQIAYDGAPIDQERLLRYLIAFRNHNEFHEQCVERIFMAIWQQCRPIKLSVYARYTRRGGLDINPFRTSHPMPLPKSIRMARQ